MTPYNFLDALDQNVKTAKVQGKNKKDKKIQVF